MTVTYHPRKKWDSSASIQSIGEHGLIHRIRKRFHRGDSSVVLGIGDDAAIFKPSRGMLLLVSTDTLRENIHFRKKYSTFYDIGWKAAAVSISDIAAMGGTPKYMLLSVAVPSKTIISDIDHLLKAVSDITKKYEVSLIGGNVSRSKGGVTIDTTVLGEVKRNGYVSRSGALKGDLIYVTGTVGNSAMGHEILESSSYDRRTSFVRDHLRPSPRVREGKILGTNRLATAMIDISDGLVADLGHVCEQSRVGAFIQRELIPFPRIPNSFRSRFAKHPVYYALYGGEDYELLFTVHKRDRQRLESLCQKEKIVVACIGEITSEDMGIRLLGRDGEKRVSPGSGYDHFKLN